MVKRRALLDELFTIASRLPWRVSAGLGIVSFVVLHVLASSSTQVPKVNQLGQLGEVVLVTQRHVLAAVLQFVLPTAFCIGALASFIKQKRGFWLLEKASANLRIAVSEMSWREFESLIAEAFRRKGFEVSERGGSNPDGGVDLVVNERGSRYIVQCKHWRSQQVGVSVVRELQGVVSVEGAAGGYVVTGGTFTSDARNFAQRTKIKLIDGNELNRWVAGSSLARMSEVVVAYPSCPTCGSEMVRRTASKGKYAGRPFWGCRGYPKCRGILKNS